MTKIDLLRLLVTVHDMNTVAIGAHLGGSSEAASMLALRLTRAGLLRREFDLEERAFYYSLTDKGRARWRYLAGHEDTHGT